MVATMILAKVDGERLQRGVRGLASGAYNITFASQTEAEIRGFVANGEARNMAWYLVKGRVSALAVMPCIGMAFANMRWPWLCM